jgi:hypothetical protein
MPNLKEQSQFGNDMHGCASDMNIFCSVTFCICIESGSSQVLYHRFLRFSVSSSQTGIQNTPKTSRNPKLNQPLHKPRQASSINMQFSTVIATTLLLASVLATPAQLFPRACCYYCSGRSIDITERSYTFDYVPEGISEANVFKREELEKREDQVCCCYASSPATCVDTC